MLLNPITKLYVGFNNLNFKYLICLYWIGLITTIKTDTYM